MLKSSLTKGAPKRRIVCDTNVLLSMLGFPGGRLDTLWEIIQNASVELFVSDFIIDELSKNLRLKAKLPTPYVTAAIEVLRGRAAVINPPRSIDIIKRKDADNRILECAVEAQATVLVTGNFKDLVPLRRFRGFEILTPRDFLDRYFLL